MELGDNAFGQMKADLNSSDGASSSSTHGQQVEEQIAVISNEQLDIEAYAALYKGRTKIIRLLFIAEKCQDVSMQLEAFKLAYDEVKKGQDVHLFRKVVQKIDGQLGPDYGMDLGWIEEVNQKAQRTGNVIGCQLNAHMQRGDAGSTGNNDENAYMVFLIKPPSQKYSFREGILKGYNDLGDFHCAHGALSNAFGSYMRAEDYCRNINHILYLCPNPMYVSIEMGHFSRVFRYVNKFMELDAVILPVTTVAKIKCAAGLALLEKKTYKDAAKMFVEATEIGDSYSEVIAAQDVATYGGLCALACFDRVELKANVINNKDFGKLLELVPEVRELICAFYSGRYACCLDHLAKLKPNLCLDIHLHDHVETLYNLIREKAIIQYTIPYVSMDMRLIATSFRTTVEQLQKELEALIKEGKIKAKIDAVNKVLYADHANERNSTFKEVLQTGSMLENDLRGMLQRINIIKNTK